uniref:Uncharacterized protein n=1 Tax=Rhizophora mucronata TaxID=61149 RepID=A0A2P2NGE5_RHIMU
MNHWLTHVKNTRDHQSMHKH